MARTKTHTVGRSDRRKSAGACAWPRAYALAALSAVSLVSLSACMFETRTPTEPGSGTGPTVVLDTAEKVFSAISESFDKLNDVDYDRAISAEFRFYPMLDDSLDGNLIDTDVYDNWTKPVERDVLNQIILSEASSIDVSWNFRRLIDENTYVRWDAGYTLTIVSAATGDTTLYGGNSQIDTRNENGQWRISYWKDISAAEGLRSWGYFRGISRRRLAN